MVFNETQKHELNLFIYRLQEQGIVNKNIGVLNTPIPMKINKVSPHAIERMKIHGITIYAFDAGIIHIIKEVKRYEQLK